MVKNPFSSLRFSLEAMQKSRGEYATGIAETAKSLGRVGLYAWLDFTAGTFEFNGKRYCYFYHPYNNTWKNERCVEVPIAWEEARRAYLDGKRVLEIGNVLSHYYSIKHDVVDKYEKAMGVKNEDVVDFKAAVPYDLILSVSTMEHVGFDETPKDETKVLRALKNLAKNLAPGGTMLLTFGMGYNRSIDRLSLEGNPDFIQWSYLKRDRKNQWVAAGKEEAANAEFNYPSPFANVLAIGIAKAPGQKA